MCVSQRVHLETSARQKTFAASRMRIRFRLWLVIGSNEIFVAASVASGWAIAEEIKMGSDKVALAWGASENSALPCHC